MQLATCPTSLSRLIMLMTKAVAAIRPRLMSPCARRYCLVSGTRVSCITRLKWSASGPRALFMFEDHLSISVSSTLHPPLGPTSPPDEIYLLAPAMGRLAEHRERRNGDDHSSPAHSGGHDTQTEARAHTCAPTDAGKPFDVHVNTQIIPVLNTSCPTARPLAARPRHVHKASNL